MTFSENDLADLAKAMKEIVLDAGAVVLNVYNDDFKSTIKADQSPVTAADELAEALILKRLKVLAPDIPVIAEEAVSHGQIPDVTGKPFFLVDPLDGTKEFISKNGEFTVNIALINQGVPILGAVLAPAIEWLFYTATPQSAMMARGPHPAQIIKVRQPAEDGLVVVASRSHRDARTDEYLATKRVKDLRSAGSSLKLCLVACGEADLYPRLGRTMEWDIAAGHAVLRAAGGRVETLDGQPLTYGKPGHDNPDFVAFGG